MAEQGRAPSAWLEVSRKELLQALRTLHKFAARRGAGDAIVGFDGGDLLIQLGGVAARARARGAWPGEAVAPGHFLANFHRSLPEADPVTVLVDGGRLKIGIVSIRCRWHPQIEPSIVLPIDAGLPHVLRIALEHDPAEIQRAGLAAVVAEAQEKRDALLERATKLLAPLEIPQEVLRSLVDALLRHRFEPHR
jgi:hypothetical protein